MVNIVTAIWYARSFFPSCGMPLMTSSITSSQA